ncbi:hypothetical protein BXZ70DRAFT_915116 [Cristinia sonorae]|uniref:Uncharacterized protein n=1 Tax=Cristinia sonorae TaxID=1940300 RepID=A0A8K0UZ91_9AGAR|nr:hypothetical protein BXZ70DRAFT_915116 [Cristinia sonorae]
MDPNAPLAVAKGTAITCSINSLIASVYGTFKRLPIGPLAASSALNGGIVGATFFSFREYVVSPQLLLGVKTGQFLRRKAELDAAINGEDYVAEKVGWWDMRAHKLPDTALSGALTGGVLNAWKRGRAGIVPGAITASLVCTFLQLAVNELGITRLKFIQEQLQKSQAEGDQVVQSLPTAQQSQSPIAVPQNTIQIAPAAPAMPTSERIFGWFGFQKVSDEDYLRRLKAERETHLKRIAELEREQAEGKQ